jgi:hypothetical protein
MTRPRILTGDTPSGRLHLGHLVGSLENRVRLQDAYECYFLIANVHAFTTRAEQPGEIRRDTIERRESQAHHEKGLSRPRRRTSTTSAQADDRRRRIVERRRAASVAATRESAEPGGARPAHQSMRITRYPSRGKCTTTSPHFGC